VRRREVIAWIGGAATWPLAARAQQPGRTKRIAVLVATAANDPDVQANLAAFTQGLQQLGWITGSNVQIDTRWGAGDSDTIRKHA